MITFFHIVALSSFFTLLYIYAGYPFLLLILNSILPKKEIIKQSIRPNVTLIVSCYNEESVIEEKIKNTRVLKYPADKLEIIVVSDASTDKTDNIVKRYSDKGIKLIRQEKRLGKTAGLNLAVLQSKGDIIVFSDANAMYEPDAIIRLVENFADKKVGYVVGQANYMNKTDPASRSENTYWRFEIFIKKLESNVHSVVGGDGAIYAIRKELYEPLQETDINDFVNPLQIIAKGYRGIFEPSAICQEETAGEFDKEFKRKTRIVNRSFSGLLRIKSVLNPFRTGLFSIQILSHKVLRWFAGIYTVIFFICSLYLAFSDVIFFQVVVIMEILLMSCAYLGYLSKEKVAFRVVYYAYYFVMVNVAALIGLFQSFRGTVQVTWEPHRSTDNQKSRIFAGKLIIHGAAAALLICLFLVIQKLLNIELLLCWKMVS